MNYESSDTIGTDDDLPPSRRNGVSLSSFPYPRVHDMEAQIHQLEREAYFSVLRAFKAQGDAITWDKESLITELRKELRLSDDEHRELLVKASSDKLIREIRERRQTGGHLNVRRSSSQLVHDVVPGPTASASRKKQKTIQLSTAFPGSSSMQPVQYSSSGALLANESAPEALVGRRVWTRWPEDNSFYEAVINQYDFATGQHVLIYDRNTPRESWEWVDIKEISPEDIRWDNGNPGMAKPGGYRGQSRMYRSYQSLAGFASGYGSGRGRGESSSQPRKELSPSQIEKKVVEDIELFDTEALVKEVEKVLDASNPDPAELEKAKKILQDQEQALLDALSKLSYASDGESEGTDPNVNIGKDNP